MSTQHVTYQPFMIIMDGYVPTEGAPAASMHTYHIFPPARVTPELIVYTWPSLYGQQIPRSAWLPSRQGYVCLEFRNFSGSIVDWSRLLRHVQLHHLCFRPLPRDMAIRLRQMGNPRVVLLFGGNHNLVLYCAQLLRLAADVPATLLVWDELLCHMQRYRNPFSRARVLRAFEYLVRRCDRRFVGAEPHRSYYEDRFKTSFGVLLPAVPDDYFIECRQWVAPQPDAVGGLRVFLSGSPHGHINASLQCLARAFRYAAQELGHAPKLVFCGTWTADLLQQLGFAPAHLESLGWLASKREVLRAASQAGCTFLPYVFDETYQGMRWEFPGRIADYLIAGPPILAHTHPDSAIAQYFKQHALPFLCVDLDDKALAAQLVQMARLSWNEREAIRRRYLSVVERFHLASTVRAALVAEEI